MPHISAQHGGGDQFVGTVTQTRLDQMIESGWTIVQQRQTREEALAARLADSDARYDALLDQLKLRVADFDDRELRRTAET